ncbi:uncharacterized protein LOC115722370 [Cannabis sativa]|uniref:uncharacterized protein LOC115722370 n=1 Tax=Cannabis sativa TaxID=3483 RepID=UPI0029C9FDC4|nr:uncharacterized protein LOC115722370 [Cannabis sativa]
MEINPTSKKRNTPFSSLINTAVGFLTRSNNGLSNNGARPSEPEEVTRKLKRPRSALSDDCDDVILKDLVKDLRSRRVFSPNSVIIGRKLEAEFDCEFLDEGDLKKVKNAEVVRITSVVEEKIANGSSEIIGSDLKTNVGDSNTEAAPENGLVKPLNGNSQNIDSDSKTKMGDLNTEVVRTTSLENGLEKPINGNSQIIHSDLKTKVIIKPCSRRKVFKTPGSVSYGRMLPYLMDITKEESCELQIDQRPKLEKGFEEKKLQITQAPQSEEISKDIAEEMEVSVEKTVPDCALESCDLGVSCNGQTFTNKDCHVPVVNDNIILTSSDDPKLEDGVIETDGNISNVNSSLTVEVSSSGTDNVLGQYSEDLRQLANEGVETLDVVQVSKDQKLTQLNDQRGRDDGGVANQLGHLKEESMQMTPPDADIFGKTEVQGNVANRDDCNRQSKENCLKKLSEEINHRNGSMDYNSRQNSKCRGVLKPRSQLKLFKSPGSFSYGRMLPFIMDIAKDNSDAFGNGYSTKPEKDLEQPSIASDNERTLPAKSRGLECKENQKVDSDAPPLNVQPTIASDNQEKLLDKSNGLECKENNNVDSAPPSLAILSSVNDSSNDEPNLTPPICSSVLNVDEIISNVLSEIETSPDHQSSPQDTTSQQVESSCTSNCSSSSRDELEMSNSNQLSVVETECNSPKLGMAVKSVETNSPSYNTPSPYQVGLKKGILKRNPRGCRGLCTCLNCASFRLHAERAFEFSKNQMEDTQEVVLDLVKELSNLRKVLEESANIADDDQIVVQASQAKEACKKAAEAEQLAQNRLTEMNYDLNIHCRITSLERPRVKFAEAKAQFPIEQVLKLEH